MKIIVRVNILLFSLLFNRIEAQAVIDRLLKEGEMIQVMENKNSVADTLFFSSKTLSDSTRIDSVVIKRKLDTLYNVVYKKNGDRYYDICYYSDGKKLEETYFYAHGDSTFQWYRSGKLKSVNFLGKNKWEFSTWYEDGSMESIKRDYGDSAIGKAWFPSGKLKSEWRNGPKGGIDGYDREWCENGQLIRQKMINRGKYKQLSYWCNGRLKSEETYINVPWLQVGKLTAWYENGVKMLENYYKESDTMEGAGVRHGTWLYWDEKGHLIKKEIFENNELKSVKEFKPKTISK